ncbi:MAG: hypothetical protein NC337_06235 [Roseburia sp.]|nr:hypothetical protein [Roseburia sp.]
MEQRHNDCGDNASLHRKKMVAPIVISVIIILYYCFYAAICLVIPIPLVVRLLMGIIPLALIGVMVYVLMERIHEIRSGEEDDLGKY